MENFQQDAQCTHNATLSSVRVTICVVEKQSSTAYSECVFVALGIRHVKRMRRIVVSSVVFSAIFSHIKLNSVALVRERTIPTERPPPVGEVNASFCGQRDVTWLAQRVPTAVNLCFLNLEPLLFYSSSSSV